MDIVNRALKFARQQEAARRKRGTEETLGEGESSFADVIQYFEQSVRHLESLNNELFFELVDFDQVRNVTSFRPSRFSYNTIVRTGKTANFLLINCVVSLLLVYAL